jgi:MFS family permease
MTLLPCQAYFSKIGMSSVADDLYMWGAFGKMGGCIFCTFFIEYFSRRRLLGSLWILASMATFAAVTQHGGEEIVHGYYIDFTKDMVVVALFVAEGFFEEASWGCIYCYSVEVYPSSMRSTGSGAAMGFGRLGGIIATLIGRKVMQEDPRLPFYFVSFAFIMAAISVSVSKVETQGTKLADL